MSLTRGVPGPGMGKPVPPVIVTVRVFEGMGTGSPVMPQGYP